MYWHGLSRAAKADPLLFTADGTEVLASASDMPYAHWTWQMPGKAGREINCAAAAAATSYDIYMGDGSLAAQAASASYLTAITSVERKYGWELVECRTALPYICEVLPDRCAHSQRRWQAQSSARTALLLQALLLRALPGNVSPRGARGWGGTVGAAGQAPDRAHSVLSARCQPTSFASLPVCRYSCQSPPNPPPLPPSPPPPPLPPAPPTCERQGRRRPACHIPACLLRCQPHFVTVASSL
jgi:hypothetical protein